MHLQFFRPKDRFNEINIDLIEEYKPNKGGHRFSLTAIDQLSGFIIASLLPDETTDSVAFAS